MSPRRRRNLSQVTPPKTIATADLVEYQSDLRYAAKVLMAEAERRDLELEPVQAEQHREVVVRLHKLHELIDANLEARD